MIVKEIAFSTQAVQRHVSEQIFFVADGPWSISNCLCKLVKNDSGYLATFFLNQKYNYHLTGDIHKFGLNNELLLVDGQGTLTIPKSALSVLQVSNGFPQWITAQVSSFYRGDKGAYDCRGLRLVIPIDFLPDFGCLEATSLKIKDFHKSAGVVTIAFDGATFQLYEYRDSATGDKFLLIDADKELPYEFFRQTADSILLAFGVLSGTHILGDYYYHRSHMQDNKFEEFIYYRFAGGTKEFPMPLVSPRSYSAYMSSLGLEADPQSSAVSTTFFGKFAQTLSEKEAFSRSCKLVIAGYHAQLLLCAGMYSIALETLTQLIYEENSQKFKLIKDPDMISSIQDPCLEIINRFKTEIITPEGDDTVYKIIEARIKQINEPSNSTKLSASFDFLQIPLSKEEKRILNSRNDFLHGKSPVSGHDFDNNKLKYFVAGLHILIVKLLFRYCGYRGHLIDYSSRWSRDGDDLHKTGFVNL